MEPSVAVTTPEPSSQRGAALDGAPLCLFLSGSLSCLWIYCCRPRSGSLVLIPWFWSLVLVLSSGPLVSSAQAYVLLLQMVHCIM